MIGVFQNKEFPDSRETSLREVHTQADTYLMTFIGSLGILLVQNLCQTIIFDCCRFSKIARALKALSIFQSYICCRVTKFWYGIANVLVYLFEFRNLFETSTSILLSPVTPRSRTTSTSSTSTTSTLVNQ